MKTFGYDNSTQYPDLLAKFQTYAHLNLVEVMHLPRCGFKDQRYTPLSNITLEQDLILFSIVEYPRDSLLSRADIDSIAREAGKVWEYSGIKIKLTREQTPDISIRFCDFAECFRANEDELFDITAVTRNRSPNGLEILINSQQAWAGESNLPRLGFTSLGLQMQLKQVSL